MPRIKRITTYTFAELKELGGSAWDQSRDTLAQWALDDDWWDGTYADAVTQFGHMGFDVDEKSIHFGLDRDKSAEFRATWRAAKVNLPALEAKDLQPLCVQLCAIALEFPDSHARNDNRSVEFQCDEDQLNDLWTDSMGAAQIRLHSIVDSMANWLANQLQAEYESRYAEDYLNDMAEANDYQFDEEGRPA